MGGEVDFSGVHYQGKAKYYLMTLPSSQPVQDFWYFTDLNDMPVQQGEAGTGPTDQGYLRAEATPFGTITTSRVSNMMQLTSRSLRYQRFASQRQRRVLSHESWHNLSFS